MPTGSVDFLYNRFKDLSQQEQIDLIELLYKNFPYSYKLGAMSEPERRFYDPNAKRA